MKNYLRCSFIKLVWLRSTWNNLRKRGFQELYCSLKGGQSRCLASVSETSSVHPSYIACGLNSMPLLICKSNFMMSRKARQRTTGRLCSCHFFVLDVMKWWLSISRLLVRTLVRSQLQLYLYLLIYGIISTGGAILFVCLSYLYYIVSKVFLVS